jgi:hypothetical protein
VVFAKNISGSDITPDIHAHNGRLVADVPFIGAVSVTYDTTLSYFLYTPDCATGGLLCIWPSESDYGTVFMSYRTALATLKITPIPLEMAGDMPLWEITTDVLVDSSQGYTEGTGAGSEWEVPTGWPTNLAFGGGLGDAPDGETASVDRRVVQSAALRQGLRVLNPTQACWQNKPPHDGNANYSPRFIFRVAPAPTDAELLSLYERYDFDADIDQLTSAESFFYGNIYDESGSPL